MAHEEPEQGHPLNARRPVEVIAERVKQVRRQRGWSAQRLSEELVKVGIKWDRSIVANFENGRRSTVSVEELLALAYVLDVAPVHLAIPLTDGTWYHFTPESATPSGLVREWVRGRHPLQSTNARLYFSEVPDNEWQPPPMGEKDIEQRTRVAKLLRDEGGEDRGPR